MSFRLAGLWCHRDFTRLWASETLSLLGAQITVLALPLTAVLTLAATPMQMGFLIAAETLPLLLVSLPAGVWLDRVKRRPVLIWSNSLRAVILLLVPVAALFGLLRLELLYLVALLVGTLSVFFDVAYQSYLPSLIPRDALVEGNSKLETSRAGAEVVGPSLGGALIQLVGAPLSLIADAFTYFVAAFLLGGVQTLELQPVRTSGKPAFWSELREGLSLIVGRALLRANVFCAATWNFASSIFSAVYLLFLTGELELSAALIGLTFMAGNVGFLVGAVVASRTAKRLGIGRTLVGAVVIGSAGALLVPLAQGPTVISLAVLATARFLEGMGSTVFSINHVSLRQALTPDYQQGRMNASVRFLAGGVVPLGALLGGVLGENLGLTVTLVIAGVIGLLAASWLIFSPVLKLYELPPPPVNR